MTNSGGQEPKNSCIAVDSGMRPGPCIQGVAALGSALPNTCRRMSRKPTESTAYFKVILQGAFLNWCFAVGVGTSCLHLTVFIKRDVCQHLMQTKLIASNSGNCCVWCCFGM